MSTDRPTIPTTDADPTDPGGQGSSLAVESGGAERISLDERHGRPAQLLLTWSSPNLEFATIFVGALGVLYFGLDFWQAAAAILVGNGLAALAHGLLSALGPKTGLSQMMIGRRAFGAVGNLLPAGLNATVAGMGWFAVNSVSGALALSGLTGLDTLTCLLITGVITCGIAFLGHNVIHLFETIAFPFLLVIFLTGGAVVFAAADPGAPAEPLPGAFWIAMAASFGYTAGWTPLAADYTRYLRPDQARSAGYFAAAGNFLSSTLLQLAGAAAVTAVGVAAWDHASPTDSYAGLLPGWLGTLTLLGICLGAISANAINLYSSSLSFAALGINLPTRFLRATLAVIVAVVGITIAAVGLDHIDSFQNFLLVTAYWIGPWLGVILADQLTCRHSSDPAHYSSSRYRNPSGPVAMLLGAGISIWLFSNQTLYVGPIPAHWPQIGDLTFLVGFAIAFIAAVGLHRWWGHPTSEPTEPAAS